MFAWLALAASASATPTWLPPEDIAGPTESITFPDVAVNPHGDAVAIWPRDVGGETVIETLERPAGGEWSVPEVLSDPAEEEPSQAHIGIDAAGNAVAVWAAFDAGFVIRTAFRPAGGDWSAPEDLSVYSARTPQLAMDAAGDAVAVWAGFDGVADEVTWAAVRPAGGEWLAPEELSVPGESDGFYPQVAIDAAGNAIAVWQRFDLSDEAVQAAVRTPSGDWSDPDVISSSGEDARTPKIAMNPAGAAIAAWSTVGGGIHAARRPAGGDWLAPDEVSSTGSDPALAVDSNGNAFALWPGPGSLESILRVAMRPPGGNWSPPQELSPEAETFQSYDLDASPAVGVVATWTRGVSSTSHEVQAAIRPPGGDWSSPQSLSAEGEDAGIPRLGFDAAGDAIAIWGRKEATAEYFLQGSGYDFAGPRLDGLRIPATGAVEEPVDFAVSPFDVFSLGATSWTFGDGSPAASGDSVSHSYSAPGEYQVTVSAVDGSGNVSTQTATISITDTVPPAPPRLLRTNPPSPNASGAPLILGTAEAGSTVRIYRGSHCAGTPLATGSAAQLDSPGIAVTVTKGATATFSATATDASQNTSLCSVSISYTRPKPSSPACVVPNVVGTKLKAARRKIAAAGCRLGKVHRPKRGKGKGSRALVVKSSHPAAGTRPADGTVDLTLGKRHRKARR
ncbi:MAG TPA: PKD domain-containing protein [Solirubrobacterales bacterium]|nr:PKD domain-containing protein [Solirubrobacterales bacterium]